MKARLNENTRNLTLKQSFVLTGRWPVKVKDVCWAQASVRTVAMWRYWTRAVIALVILNKSAP